MATIDQLRALFPDASSDADVLHQASSEFGIPVAEIASEVGYGPKGGLTRQQFSASADQYQAGLYGVGEAVTGALGASSASKWLKKRREENELEADLASQHAREMGAVDQWKDVHGVGDFGSYAKGLAIQSLPYAAEAIAGGALARGAMAGTRAALGAATAAKDIEGVAAATKALNRGSLTGATAASYPSSVGDILQNQREQAGETNLGAAAALGVPYAALNALGETGLLAKGALPKNPINLLDDMTGLKGGLARGGAAVLKTGAEESIGETGQEMINQMGRIAVDKQATMTDPEALERYKESAIGGFALGGLMGGATGWRRSQEDTNEIASAMGYKDASQPSITTAEFPSPAQTAPLVAATMAATQPAPAVQGGTTDVALAQQQAAQEAQQVQAAQQQQATREKMYTEFGIANPEDPTKGNFFGKPLFGPAVAQVADALAVITQTMTPVQLEITQAVNQASAETGGKLLNFQFNAADPAKSVQKAFEAVGKVATAFQIGHVQTVQEAAQILNEQSRTLTGNKLDQLNAIHQALTGEDTVGYQEAQQTKAEKGAKNGKLQLQQQTTTGLGTVPVQGNAGEAGAGGNGPVRSAEVQPVGTASVGAGSLGLQAGQPSTGGVRSGTTGNAPASDAGQPTPHAQVSEATNAQPTTETTVAAEAPAERTAAPRGEPVAPSGEVLENTAEATLDNVPALVRNILRMVYPKSGEGRIELYAAFMSQKAGFNAQQETQAQLAARYGLKESTVKDYINKDLKLGKSGFPLFIERDAEKFRAALKFQANKMGISIDELSAALESTLEQDIAASEAAGIADEVDMIVNGMAIQTAQERVDAEGNKTGKIDRTNVTSLAEEGKTMESLMQQYLDLSNELEAATEANDERVEALQAQVDALTAKIAEQEKAEKRRVREMAGKKSEKEETNAVQEQSAGEVDVRQPAGNGEALGEGNAKPEKLARKSEQVKTEAKPETKVEPKRGEEGKVGPHEYRGTDRDQAMTQYVDMMKAGKKPAAIVPIGDVQEGTLQMASEIFGWPLTEINSKSAGGRVIVVGVTQSAHDKALAALQAMDKEGETQATATTLGESLGYSDADIEAWHAYQAAWENPLYSYGEAKVEPKQEKVDEEGRVKTPAEQWGDLALATPGMPAYDELTTEQKNRWDDLARRGVANLAAANKLVTSTPTSAKTETSTETSASAPEQKQVAAQVEKLSDPQVKRLEKHYGVSRDSSEFLSKLGEDVVSYVSKGVEAVSAAIRDIVKAVAEGVMAFAIIVNPNLASDNFKLNLPQTVQTVIEQRAEVPMAAKAEMSAAAQSTYQIVAPIAKEANKWFMITDKVDGKLHVFDAEGNPVVQAPALTGRGVGDKVIGGNGVTPAGKFSIQLAEDHEYTGGYRYDLVESYDGSGVIAVHAVWTGEKSENRPARLASKTAADNRISWGCINVSNETMLNVLVPNWENMNGSLMFVMPENPADIAKTFPALTKTVTQTSGAAGKEAQTRTLAGKEEQTPAGAPATQAKTTQQSRRRERSWKYSKDEFISSIKDFMNRNALGKNIIVLDSMEDLRTADEFAMMDEVEFNNFLTKEGIDNDTQAFWSPKTGNAYFVASNINIGTARGVFLHEIGGHMGLQKWLSPEVFNRLAERVISWAKAEDGSTESKLARKAAARVSSAEDAAIGQGLSMSKLEKRQELVAYFLEEAVNAGINPRAYDNIGSAGLREWMRTLWAAFKNALRYVRGFNSENLTGQDLVDLAYGYAQLNTAARFHGTNAAFRKFNLNYMGSGVGNQQYGWGAYFAQRRMTGETYSIPDVKAPADTKSYLHAVDLAVDDDEWLHWDKPVEEQSVKVQTVLGKLGLTGKDGGDQYTALAVRLFKTQFGREPANKRETQAAYKAASQLLDKLGIKGINYRDANDINRVARNLVVFNDKNIVRIQTQHGMALDRKVQSDQTANIRWERVQQSRATRLKEGLENALPSGVAKPAKSAVTNLLTAAKNGLLSAGITEDIVAMASKYMRSANDYLAAQFARQKTRLEFEMRIESILDAFDKLPKHLQGEGAGSVNRYILDSTMSKKWGFYPGVHRIGTTLFETDPDLEKRFKEFPPAAQQVIRNVFEHGYIALKSKQAAIDAAIDREFADRERDAAGDADAMAEVAAAKKLMRSQLTRIQNIDFTVPYAYLGRYGDYVVAAKSKEFKHWEERVKANDFDKERAIGWLAENSSNPDHYVVQFAETQGEADQIAADLMATGLYDMDGSEAGPKEAIASYVGSDVHLAVARLRNLINRKSGEDGEGSAELNRMISDLYLMTAAESSARKSEIMRKYVSGANANMMRNLATSGRADAHFLSTMQHNDDITEALENMRNEAKRNVREAMPLYNELFTRQTNSLDYKPASTLSRALTQATSVWFLATSPAFYLQQSLQTLVLSLPYMAGRLGYFRSFRAIKAAYNDTAALVKGLGVNDHIDFAKAPADVRAMLQTLVGMGKIDIGIDADAKARAGEHGVTDVVMRKLQGVNNRIEAINRATAAIAAYRGYIQRHGVGSSEAATKFAAEVVSNTHGSYDGFNTPRILNNDTGRLVGQFKRFQIIQLSMLGKLISNAFKGASHEERVIARRALAFITGHMAVLGGALGVPFVQQVGNALLAAFGDDDEPKDLEYMLRQAIGDKTMADLLLNGVPAAMGVNLGGKLGMGNVASILPFTDIDLSSRSGYEKVMVGMMGPFFGGLAPKFVDGFGMMGKGEYYKGLELLMPNGIGNAMKGVRYANEGVTMRNGDVVLKPEEISLMDAAFQAVGLPTTTITGRQYTQRVAAEFDKFYADKANEIKGSYVNAQRAGDTAGMADARKEWEDLQTSRRKNGYTTQPMSELFKATLAARKREANVVNGVEAKKSNKQFVQNII